MRLSLLGALLLCAVMFCPAAGSAQKQSKVIVNPSIASNNAYGKIFISKVELADTAAILHFDAYYNPGPDSWFRIEPGSSITGGSGKVYKLKWAKGITLGNRESTPESGHIAFSLGFEPVAKDELTIDFKESDNENDFRMLGIKLYDVPVQAGAVRCTLRGTVVDRPYSSLLMLAPNWTDSRVVQPIYIPVRDGRFEYVLDCGYEEVYDLIFVDEYRNGGWRPIHFIAENATVDFELHPMQENDKNRISGGPLNTSYQGQATELKQRFQPVYEASRKEYEILESEKRYFTPEAYELLAKSNEARQANDVELSREYSKKFMALQESGEAFTPEALKLRELGNNTRKEMQAAQLEYARNHKDIIGYTVLYDVVQSITHSMDEPEPADIVATRIIYDLYAVKYPDHPYTVKLENVFTGLGIKKGKPYVDVTMTDLKGNPVKLSSKIEGKVTLLNLWASWCGPCREHGIEMIPVYEDFKAKGFNVIGVAREQNNTKAMEAAISRDKYPWENFVEMNDNDKIWAKYGVGNGGGALFLIDSDGTVLAVSPSAEETRAILSERLK